MLDVFSTLAKYAHRQEENFLTEAFVYLLNYVLEREPVYGMSVLANLLSIPIEEILDRNGSFLISTQDTYEEGRPDIVIRMGDDCLFFVEVKHDSKIGYHQLESYLDAINKETQTHKKLVLLTRSKHSIQETDLEAENFHHVCWYEISGWLSDQEIDDEVITFLITEFLDFLSGKEMSMERVSWEYIKGVPAQQNLIHMLGIALGEALPEKKIKKTAGWSWMGYYIGEGTDLWVGIRYRDPLHVVMEDDNGNDPTFQRILSLEETHFFSLTAGEQVEKLILFISESYPQR